MEQGNGDNVVRDCAVWSPEETEIAQTLVDMRDLMLDMDSDLKIPFQWGRKRKRSAIRGSISSSSSSRGLLPPSYSQKTALRNSNGGCSDGGGDGGVVAAAAAKVKVKVEASSPATPLSLSLTESDEKPNDKPLRMKASLKRKKDYYLKSIEDLNERRARLNQEMEKVSSYYEELKAYNLKLKERKQEIINGLKREPKNPISQIGCQMQQQLVNPSNSMAQNQNHNNHHHHHQQLQEPNTPQIIRLRINQNSGTPPQSNLLLPMQPSNPSTTCTSSPSASLTMVNNPNMGPLGGVVLDLNVSPEELVHMEPYQPLDVNVGNKDLNRVMAAQARQRRIQINRLKNPIGNNNNNNNNNKPRYSCRA